MADDQDITPAILLEHMQSMEQRLTENFTNQLDTKLHSLDKKLTKRFDSLDKKITKRFDSINTALQRLYKKRIDMVVQLDGIKKEQLPKRVRRIEKHLDLPSFQVA